MMRKAATAVICLALVSLLGACAKKKGYASAGEVFGTYDADKNGVITREEFLAKWQDKQKAQNAWKKIDTKDNGFVDRKLNDEIPVSVWNEVESQNLP